jgi:hypothetical protein
MLAWLHPQLHCSWYSLLHQLHILLLQLGHLSLQALQVGCCSAGLAAALLLQIV